MGKYRVKINEEDHFCAEFKETRKGLRSFYIAEGKPFVGYKWMYMPILYITLFIDWVIQLVEGYEWMGLQWQFENHHEFGVDVSKYKRTWYKTDDEVQELMKFHKESLVKKSKKFEQVIYESR